MKKKGYGIVLAVIASAAVFTGAVIYNRQKDEEVRAKKTDIAEVRNENGYDLTIDRKKEEKIRAECIAAADQVSEIYRKADKGEAANVVLSDGVQEQMQKRLAEDGYSVITSEVYNTMSNYSKMDQFLKKSRDGEKGAAVLYSITGSGIIIRQEYLFDKKEMYLFSATVGWNRFCEPTVSDISCTRIDEWKYTDKGWFCYKLCVPQPPEVTEIIDSSEMIRVIPLPEEYRKLSLQYVFPLCYKGNNILCSDWDTANLSEIDYNGVYEYFYQMKYGIPFNPDSYPSGIPGESFESVIMEYLPVTAEEIRKWAVYDKKTETYAWTRLGCGNYKLSYFGTSVPEVVGLEKKQDGTEVLTVDAVCEMMIADDRVITHELTIRREADGSFRYMGNRILNDGVRNIPKYEYRISGDLRTPDPHIR